jgi:hypothetical protein
MCQKSCFAVTHCSLHVEWAEQPQGVHGLALACCPQLFHLCADRPLPPYHISQAADDSRTWSGKASNCKPRPTLQLMPGTPECPPPYLEAGLCGEHRVPAHCAVSLMQDLCGERPGLAAPLKLLAAPLTAARAQRREAGAPARVLDVEAGQHVVAFFQVDYKAPSYSHAHTHQIRSARRASNADSQWPCPSRGRWRPL